MTPELKERLERCAKWHDKQARAMTLAGDHAR